MAGRNQTLALLQQEIDDHRHERAGDHPEHRNAEQDKQPTHDPTRGRSHERRISLAEHSLDARLKESNTDASVQGFSNTVIRTAAIATNPTMPSASVRKNAGRSGRRAGAGATPPGRMIGVERTGTRSGDTITPIVPHDRVSRQRFGAPWADA